MNILIVSSISKDAIEKPNDKHDVICAFNAPEEKLISLMHDGDVIIFRSGVKISERVMIAGPNLKFLIRLILVIPRKESLFFNLIIALL